MINFFTNLKQKFLPKYNDLDKDHYFIESNNQKIFFDVNDIANRNLIRWSLKQRYNKSNAHKNIFYYEKKQFSIMQSILGKSEVFWDIGCQTGIYSLSAYFFQNIKKIVSVDIMPVFINTLKKNIHLNKFDFKKFIILNVGVGSKLVSQTEYLASNSVKGVNFDYISKTTFDALMKLSIENKKPIGNGIITALNKDQARARCGSYDLKGHRKNGKGEEAANSVIAVLSK